MYENIIVNNIVKNLNNKIHGAYNWILKLYKEQKNDYFL